MKKSVVAILVILALVVIVSPGILGRLAEKSVDENLNWAAQEQGDVVVSSDNFDRGWFSSDGQHRIEIKGGVLAELGEPGDDLPVLVINTHLDHGLIPFSSLSRENGSLSPGLGNAVSTLAVEFSDGKTIEIPGKIFSRVGLGGAIASSYQVAEGSHTEENVTISWGATKIDIKTDTASGDVTFDGDIGGISSTHGDQDLGFEQTMGVEALTFSGSQARTKYGFSTGDMKMSLDEMSVAVNGAKAGGLKTMDVDGYTKLDGDRVGGRTTFKMESAIVPQFGEISVIGDVSLMGADAEAIGSITRAMNTMGPNADPMQAFPTIEGDLKRLLAAGLEMRFDQFEVALPMGTVEMKLNLEVAEEDPDTFEWTSLLLGTQGAAQIAVPEALVDMALATNPQAGAVVGMGFLVKNGDVYEMDAKLEKGLLTINGAPIPIPLGAF
ncbi:MAG: YdgA family protein [Woeseiaceae bacterium]